MAAIQRFFDNNRNVKQRMVELRVKRIEDYQNKLRLEEEKRIATIEEEFVQFDSLLRRNWFVNDYDIIDLVWEASEEVFERIKSNLHTYPERIQEVLMYTFDPPKLTTKKCRELSDDDMVKMTTARQEQLDKKVNEAWEIYKKEKGLTRPDGDVDSKHTELYEDLQSTKRELEDYKKNASKKYVPPSMRGKGDTDPVLDTLEKKILKLENEIVEVKKDIQLEERIWENGKKTSVYQQLLESVQ
jgi:hypothetical protein